MNKDQASDRILKESITQLIKSENKLVMKKIAKMKTYVQEAVKSVASSNNGTGMHSIKEEDESDSD